MAFSNNILLGILGPGQAEFSELSALARAPLPLALEAPSKNGGGVLEIDLCGLPHVWVLAIVHFADCDTASSFGLLKLG